MTLDEPFPRQSVCVPLVLFPPFFLFPLLYLAMPGQRILLFLAAQVLFAGIAIFLSNSPYTRMSTAPTKQWADGPMKLVVTPQYETKKVSS